MRTQMVRAGKSKRALVKLVRLLVSSPAFAALGFAHVMTNDPVVLLVEDNELVRGSVSAVLRREGFEVLAVATGEEAIWAIESEETGFAVALIDLSLPDIPGERVVVALRLRDPDVRILAISGYPANMLKRQLETIGVNSFLQKPFDTEELLGALTDLRH